MALSHKLLLAAALLAAAALVVQASHDPAGFDDDDEGAWSTYVQRAAFPGAPVYPRFNGKTKNDININNIKLRSNPRELNSQFIDYTEGVRNYFTNGPNTYSGPGDSIYWLQAPQVVMYEYDYDEEEEELLEDPFGWVLIRFNIEPADAYVKCVTTLPGSPPPSDMDILTYGNEFDSSPEAGMRWQWLAPPKTHVAAMQGCRYPGFMNMPDDAPAQEVHEEKHTAEHTVEHDEHSRRLEAMQAKKKRDGHRHERNPQESLAELSALRRRAKASRRAKATKAAEAAKAEGTTKTARRMSHSQWQPWMRDEGPGWKIMKNQYDIYCYAVDSDSPNHRGGHYKLAADCDSGFTCSMKRGGGTMCPAQADQEVWEGDFNSEEAPQDNLSQRFLGRSVRKNVYRSTRYGESYEESVYNPMP